MVEWNRRERRVEQATRKRLFGFAKAARRRLALWLSTATVAGVAVYYVGTRIARRIRAAIDASSSTPELMSGVAETTDARMPVDMPRIPPAPVSLPPGAEMLDTGVWKCPDRIADVRLVGSIEGHTYHRSSCLWAKNIKDENRICFADIRTAQDRGYNACGTCKPA
jgi:hypothetical protein